MRQWKRLLACILSVMMLAGLCIPASAAEVVPKPFTDVQGKDTSEAISRLVDAGIVKGVGDNKYNPTGTLTRAEFMTLLGRASKVTVDHTVKSSFTDVGNDGWSTGYITWGSENGLIEGYGDNRFGPYDTLTEEQVNLILTRYNSKFNAHVPLYNAPSKDATRANVAILLAAGFTYEYTEPVEVDGGKIRGYKSMDGTINVYKGVPYAADAGGENRWKEPQPVEEWEGIRDCVTWGASAIQTKQEPFMMWSTEYIIEDTGYDEDCLSLNVWSKDDDLTGKPVLVYIHGGGNTSGGSSCEVYNGEYIASQDIVFVNVNYRVGVFGFLSLPELTAEAGHSGNYAIMDLVQSLKWVQKNIGKFGGDANNVTIMGQSAGASNVTALTYSPLAKGLFNKAIAESSMSVNSTITTQEAREEAGTKAFGNYTLEQLRAMPAYELMEINNSGGTCCDGYVFTESHLDALKNGTDNDATVITGMVADDPFMMGKNIPESATAYEESLKDKYGENAEKILAIYPSSDYENSYVTFTRENSLYRLEMTAKFRNEYTELPTYVYFMPHVQPGDTADVAGAFHTSDVPYFLNILSNCRAEYWTESEHQFAKMMSDYLVNFVKTGDPNGTGLATWAPSDGTGSYMNLDLSATGVSLSQEKMELFAVLNAQ